MSVSIFLFISCEDSSSSPSDSDSVDKRYYTQVNNNRSKSIAVVIYPPSGAAACAMSGVIESGSTSDWLCVLGEGPHEIRVDGFSIGTNKYDGPTNAEGCMGWYTTISDDGFSVSWVGLSFECPSN